MVKMSQKVTGGTLYGTEPITFTNKTDYNLDGVGNRINVVKDGITTTYTVNSLNQYTYVDSTNYIYDLNGNLKDDGTYLYVYDYRNQLVEIKRKSDNVAIATYKYDILGRRIEKATLDGTVRYYYSGSQIVEEYNSGEILQAKFVYGNSIDEILTMERNTHIYYYHTNVLGSVTNVTDETGTIVEYYRYDAYGRVTIYNVSSEVITTSTIGNIYYFTGRQLDNESGLYYYRARYYSAEMGRFLQRDSMEDDELLNLYIYVENNPLNNNDPWGLFSTGKGGFLVKGGPEHENMTKEAAKELGYSEHAAKVLAAACACVDAASKEIAGSTEETYLNKHYLTNNESDRESAKLRAEHIIKDENGTALSYAGSDSFSTNPDEGVTQSLQALGRASHTIQDKHSHAVSRSGKQVPGVYPQEHDAKNDRKETNSAGWQAAKEETKQNIKDFENKLRGLLKDKPEAYQEWVIYRLKNLCNKNLMNYETYKKSYTPPPKKIKNK